MHSKASADWPFFCSSPTHEKAAARARTNGGPARGAKPAYWRMKSITISPGSRWRYSMATPSP